MSIQEMLISLYIKDGAQALMNYVQGSLQKKKGKKACHIQQIIPLQSSVLNFIELPKRPTIPYFQSQIIRSLEGKNRSSIFDVNNEEDCLADISKFRILYEKYLVPSQNYARSNQNQELDMSQIKRVLALRLFSSCCSDDQIQLLSHKTSNQINQKRKCITSLAYQMSVEHSKIANLKETIIDHTIYCQEVTHQLYQHNQTILNAPQSIILQSQNHQGKIIALTEKIQQQWTINFLAALNLKQMAQPSKIIPPWPSNLLEKEQKQIIASQITGKVLFQIEEKIRKTKQITNKLDFNRQYQFRHKNIGIHSHMHRQYNKNEQKMSNRQQNSSQSPPKSAIEVHSRRGKLYSTQIESEQNHYIKMAERVNNLKKKQALNKQYSLQQKNNFSKPSGKNLSNMRSNLHIQNSYHNFHLKPLKPSPLRLEDLQKQQYQAPASNKKPSMPIKQLKNDYSYRNLTQSDDFPQKKIKFPLKIQRFQMNSMQESYLCYPIDSINLKQLPLQFLKDRHKFNENRVKIEYPCRADSSIQQLVRKSMQILNCLGAEIYCQEQTSYKTYHSIDQDDILAVSWLIQCPVKDVIKLYSQFFGKCPTKK